MDIETMCFRCGIGIWVQDIKTLLPVNASAVPFQIGKILQTDIGFIYGLVMYSDGVDADGDTMVSTTQCQNMYLNLKDGASDFIQRIRLSDLLNEFSGSPVIREKKYTPIAITRFDLSNSTYANPLAYTSSPANVSVNLKLYYIQVDDWKMLEKHLNIKALSPSRHIVKQRPGPASK